MITPLKSGFVIMALIFWSCLAASAQTPPRVADDVVPSDKSLVDRLQEILNIPQGDMDPFSNLTDVVNSFGQNATLDNPAADRFAQACMKGGDFNMMSRLAAQLADLSSVTLSVVTSPRWKYGGSRDHDNLMKYLWGKSQDTLTPSTIAAVDARAAAILGAADEYFADVARFAFLMRDEKKFDKIAALNVSQAAALHDLIADALNGNKVFGEKMLASITLQTNLIKSSQSVLDPGMIKDFLAAITQLRAAASRMPGREREAVEETWEVLNLARHKQDSQTQTHIDQYLDDWMTEAGSLPNGKNGPLYRWLEMARTQIGPMPSVRMH